MTRQARTRQARTRQARTRRVSSWPGWAGSGGVLLVAAGLVVAGTVTARSGQQADAARLGLAGTSWLAEVLAVAGAAGLAIVLVQLGAAARSGLRSGVRSVFVPRSDPLSGSAAGPPSGSAPGQRLAGARGPRPAARGSSARG